MMTQEQKDKNIEIAKTAKSGVIQAYNNDVKIVWDSTANVTQFGLMAYFIEFLKSNQLFDCWVRNCPIKYTSNNSPKVRDVLGTLMMSLLAGHNRYAHITSIRSDRVNPELLGMSQVVSEDSVRRGLSKIGEVEGGKWLMGHLERCYESLLTEPWILDIDATVKPLYGKQEGAVVGYNPQKPGRPSHVYHTYIIGTLRLIMDAEVHAGNESSSLHGQPGLLRLLDSLDVKHRPYLVRGDCGYGNEKMMLELEKRGLNYLFKLKQSKNVKRLISQASFSKEEWRDAGQGWEGLWSSVRLDGWTNERRVMILRRSVKEEVAVVDCQKKQASQLPLFERGPGAKYEYAVLVTSLDDEIITVAQLYRDRADIENVFDEMKNQWGWGGFTTQELAKCRLMARISALVFNWWSLFSGLVFPDEHAEAITSRPMLLYGVGRQTRHAGQDTVSVTSSHGKSDKIEKALKKASNFLLKIKATAEHLIPSERWKLVLSRIFFRFLRGRILGPPKLVDFYPA